MSEPRARQEIWRVAGWAIQNVNLPRNVAKGHWRDVSRLRLFLLLLAEVRELASALWTLHRLRRRYCRVPWHKVQVRTKLADHVEQARRDAKHEIGDCVAFLAYLGDRV